jgi:hypothetical protein
MTTSLGEAQVKSGVGGAASVRFARIVRAVRWPLLISLATACAPLPPPRAIVTLGVAGGPPRNAVLAMPTTCEATESILCDPATYDQGTDGAVHRPVNDFGAQIEPIVRLKLELAGYTLVDARTLRLSTVERTETTTASEHHGSPSPEATTTRLGDAPSVASLAPADRTAAAQSLGLAGELSSTLRISRDGPGFGARIRFELALELRALPEGTVLWTARCGDLEEDPEGTARLVASCAGDGVLAWRAPDAVIGGVP